MDEIDYESDRFEDILAKDSRYAAKAYALLMDVVHYLGENGERISAEAIMDDFRDRALDQFGPLAYTVLTSWGLKSCEDLGEMMFNLADHRRVKRDEDDSHESFVGGYDFKETFLDPFEA